MDVAATLSDPLTLLREFTVAKEPISLVGDYVVFGRVRCAHVSLCLSFASRI